MTRLKTADIAHIAASLTAFDETLKSQTGCNLTELASRAAGFTGAALLPLLSSVRAAVVPVRSGRGIIGGFAHTVQAILVHIGITAQVTTGTDVAGLAEAVERNNRLVFMADDERFIALDVLSGSLVDNGDATGKGFATALALAARGVSGKEVLLLGCGRVGSSAAFTLAEEGAHVGLYDPIEERGRDLADRLKKRFNRDFPVHRDLSPASARYRLFVDACPGGDLVPPGCIFPDTYVAAPGMPPGLNDRAREKIGTRLIHDPLQTGTAVMAAIALGRMLTKDAAPVHRERLG